jgi:hypothetical protein
MEVKDVPAKHKRGAVTMLETISAPSPRQGIGSALRAAYTPKSSELPVDFRKLLEKLH